MHIKFWYLSIVLTPVVFNHFLSSMFYPYFNKQVLRGVNAIVFPLAVFVVFSPMSYSTALVPCYQLFILAVLLYEIYFLISLSIQQNIVSAFISLSGFVFIFLTGINDILYAHNMVPTNYLLHFGFLIFIIIQAFIVARENAFSRKKAEILSCILDKKEKQLRLLIGNLKSVVYRFLNDNTYSIDFLSNGCRDLTGFKSSEFSSFKDLYKKMIHPDDQEELYNILRTEKEYGIHYRIITAEGEEKWVWDQGDPVFNTEGECIAYEGFLTDISRAKNTEKALSEFISIASHELRTPVSIILLNVTGLLGGYSGVLPDDAMEDIAEIKSSVERIIQLTDNLLDLAKIEAKDIDINLSRIPILKLINSSLELVLPLIDKSRHKLHVNVEIPFDIMVDTKRISQVFTNLLNNAVKYTPEDGVIVISAEKKNDIVTIKIADNGYGVPIWAQTKIFENFFQADYIMSHKVGGSGLGLTIARKIVEQHGGKLYCHSPISHDDPHASCFQLNDERKGSIFIIELPSQS